VALLQYGVKSFVVPLTGVEKGMPIPVVDGEDTAYCIRRTYLNDILLRQARSLKRMNIFLIYPNYNSEIYLE
jgi:hypothetical protein